MSTHNVMPMCECPCCGHKWQADDWYALRVGDTIDCPECEQSIAIVDHYQEVTMQFDKAKP
jgi:Zn finger protein HypA/HybF involved in hydrogenase expression